MAGSSNSNKKLRQAPGTFREIFLKEWRTRESSDASSKPAVVLGGLGKSTRRGIRRCPACGTMNGTKVALCKNENCKAVFKEAEARNRVVHDTCQLDTGNYTRVYSVRVRDSGAEQRGFVQMHSASSETNSVCFVDQCHSSFRAKVLHCHERNKEQRSATCAHIASAMQCTRQAVPLTVHLTVLNALAIAPSVKEAGWAMATECSGPAVQRVSRDVMAVRSDVTSKFPLGYVHTTFAAGRSDHDLMFYCPCQAFKESAGRGLASERRCVHIFMCICAFVNQDTLREEFKAYIRLEVSLAAPTQTLSGPIEAMNEEEGDDITEVDLSSLLDCHVEVLGENVAAILDDSAILKDDNVTSMLTDGIVFSSDDLSGVHAGAFDLALSGVQLPSQELPVLLTDSIQTNLLSEELLPFIEEATDDMGPLALAEQTTPAQAKRDVVNNRAALAFLEWLSSVTEAVNQKMHYFRSGDDNHLVFHTPARFWMQLRERLYRCTGSVGGSQRLKTSVTKHERVPGCIYLTHTWLIYSRHHVKAILDTPQVPLRLVRSFTSTDETVFRPSDGSSPPQEGTPTYRTYLKIDEMCPFRIGWTPDVLPITHVGELTIDFAFAHTPAIS